jgi:hypothetical protein
MLPDDYLRKLKQDLSESDAAADSATRRELETEESNEQWIDEAPTS